MPLKDRAQLGKEGFDLLVELLGLLVLLHGGLQQLEGGLGLFLEALFARYGIGGRGIDQLACVKAGES